MRTPDLCKVAVSKDSSLIILVPEELRTAEIYKIAVRGGWHLSNVPEKLRTEEICKIAVEKSA